MATVHEATIDSPTIPGRPPLQKRSPDDFERERSNSAPGLGWQANPFVMPAVTVPAKLNLELPVKPVSLDTVNQEPSVPPTEGRQLSPILSPGAMDNKESLGGEMASTADEKFDIPPPVPPKLPTSQARSSPKHQSARKGSTQLPPGTSGSSSSSNGTTASITESSSPSQPQLCNPATKPCSTTVASDTDGSRCGGKLCWLKGHCRNRSDTSVMERGRPKTKGASRGRSRTCSEADCDREMRPDNWSLPTGMRPAEASTAMDGTELEYLRKQAVLQAEKYEILSRSTVKSLSRELRALDERCEYLRKTHKSLRAGRHKLHGRMVAYLKRGESLIFSRESILKLEEAILELDRSIDEFIVKLEQSENRRLRVRQKLLEHVAAAMVPASGNHHPNKQQQQQHYPAPAARTAEATMATPPRSPVQPDSPVVVREEKQHQAGAETIRIYADGHVLSLFSDIETAIGRMCEAC